MAVNGTASDAPSQDASPVFDLVNAILDRFLVPIVDAAEAFLLDRTPAGLLGFEERAQEILAQVGGHVVGSTVTVLLDDEDFRSQAVQKARTVDPRNLRNQGWRQTSVRFLGGVVVLVRTPYLAPDRSRGSRRRVGRRGKGGEGVFPALVALGIHDRATPALASLAARLSVRCSSFEEASEALGEHGIDMDAKTVRRLALHVGEAALRQREARVEAAQEGRFFTNEFAGRRIAISVDGGRTRLREGGLRGRRGKSGRRRYKTPWREPKVFTVYVFDAKGRKVRAFPPLIDGTFGDADATFRLLVSELLLRGASRAELIVVGGDGALWIWNRVDALVRALGLPPEKIVRVADFYHAVEHLTAVADLVRGFSESAKRTWVKRMRRRLKKGKVEQVIECIEKLCRGRYAKKIRTEAEYFRKRLEYMRYDEFERQGIPLGSGAVESAVRRVVNLRLKGASIFWRESSAEAVLHLRAYLKAGRWGEIVSRGTHRSDDGGLHHPLQAAA